MKNDDERKKNDIEHLEFDEYGRYQLLEILDEDDLELIGGGDVVVNVVTCPQINAAGCQPKVNVAYCPGAPPPPPPPPPKPNSTCGEDGDGE